VLSRTAHPVGGSRRLIVATDPRLDQTRPVALGDKPSEHRKTSMRQFRTGFRRVSTGIRRDRDAPLALGRCAVGRGGRSSILHQDATTYTPNAGHVTSHPDNAGHPAPPP